MASLAKVFKSQIGTSSFGNISTNNYKGIKRYGDFFPNGHQLEQKSREACIQAW
jgi:hypothetical protein